jgi:hypothetical protein
MHCVRLLGGGHCVWLFGLLLFVVLDVLGDDGSVSGSEFLEDWREGLVHFLHRRSPTTQTLVGQLGGTKRRAKVSDETEQRQK